jgi:hypothetical protein
LSNCYYQRVFIDHLYQQKNTDIGVHINIDSLVSRYFAIVVPRHAAVRGKSSGLVIILQTLSCRHSRYSPGGNRSDHHFAVLDAVRYAAVERPRLGADPFHGV